MSNNVFSENMKKFRLEKKLTQEEAAAVLNVSTQAVSRWECGTTMPDIMLLPEIAELYGITIDALYRKSSVAYENYAERLSAVYEMTDEPEDFLRADIEYKKLMKSGNLSQKDKFCYGFMHHQMIRYCRKKAFELYDSVLGGDPEADIHSYKRVKSLRAGLMKELGKSGEDMIAKQKDIVSKNPSELECLHFLELLTMFDKNEEAYDFFIEANAKYPNNADIILFGGGAAQGLKRYDEALALYRKAGEFGTEFHSDIISIGNLYEEMGEIEKATEALGKVAELYADEGYEFEAKKMLKYIDKLQAKRK